MMHKALHPRNGIDRLYVSRKEGGRKRAYIKDCGDATIQGLKEFIKKSKERQFTATSNSNGNIGTNRETTNLESKNEKEKQ